MESILKLKKSRLKRRAEIGRGCFSKVYLGDLQGLPTEEPGPGPTVVAVKVISPKGMSRSDAIAEIQIMAQLKHEHVVELIGMIENKVGIPWLIMEYMENGDLLHYIKTHESEVTDQTLLRMTLDIASGMEYLHIKHALVHGDLHTKNCFVSSGHRVKVGDFGFSSTNSGFSSENLGAVDPFSWRSFQGGVPSGIRWLAPEYISTLGFDEEPHLTHQPGDVWAFGILLFEVWSKGECPYGRLSNRQVLKAVASGRNPSDFAGDLPVPATVFTLMLDAWRVPFTDRPDFSEIVSTLTDNFSF